MKIFPFFLAASVAGNVALLAMLAKNAFFRPPTVTPARVETAPTRATPTASTAAQAWTELQADDLAAQVERLRAEEFPPSLVRAIMAAQVRERFAARRKALETADADTPYWIANRDPKTQAEQRALAREEQKALRELLGPDPDNGPVASLRRMLPNIAAEKIEQLAQIQERYNEQRSDLYATGGGRLLPDEMEKIEALEKAMRAEFAAVLTPDELEDYDLRASRTANQLRYNLAAFDATEQEYRAIFKLQSAFDEQYGRMQSAASPEQMRARSEAQRQLKEQIKAALGPERAADYERATDFNYRRTTQVVERLGLPATTANEIYALQQSTQQRLNEARRARTAEERNANLTAIAKDVETQLAAKLGATGLEAYKQHAGSWLTNIVPRPALAPKQ